MLGEKQIFQDKTRRELPLRMAFALADRGEAEVDTFVRTEVRTAQKLEIIFSTITFLNNSWLIIVQEITNIVNRFFIIKVQTCSE
jgi:hypothetical protein